MQFRADNREISAEEYAKGDEIVERTLIKQSKTDKLAYCPQIAKLKEGYDSLMTCEPYQTYLLDENGPLNFSMGLAHKNSEQLPKLYHFTNGIDLAPKHKLKEWHYNYGPNAYRMMINKREAADIDDVYDYEMAKALYAMKDPHPTTKID